MQDRSPLYIRLTPTSVALVLAAVAAMLVIASSVGQYARFGLGHGHVFGLVRLFYLDSEMNISTWYSSFLLLFAAVLLALVAAAERGPKAVDRRYWAALAAIFLYLSIDEAAAIHESYSVLFDELFGPRLSNLIVATWTIPAGLLVLACGLLYLRFFRRLPKETRRLFVLAGGLYLFGAIGIELAGHQEKRLHGTDTPIWSLFITIEESFEMGGAIVFVYSLLTHLKRQVGVLVIQFGRPTSMQGKEMGWALGGHHQTSLGQEDRRL